MAHKLGIWQKASVSCHVSLSIDFLSMLTSLQLASPKARDPKRKQSRSHSAFYDLALEMIQHYFYCNLVTETNPVTKEGISQGHKYQELGIVGGYLRGWLPQHTHFYGNRNFFKEIENMAPILEQVLLIYFISLSGFLNKHNFTQIKM